MNETIPEGLKEILRIAHKSAVQAIKEAIDLGQMMSFSYCYRVIMSIYKCTYRCHAEYLENESKDKTTSDLMDCVYKCIDEAREKVVLYG
ncbi:MAG: hypothetical protein GXO68_05700 [Crenarchaeota archaeon]|nr:hypothetical protein [Thermoproteota archaeon]